MLSFSNCKLLYSLSTPSFFKDKLLAFSPLPLKRPTSHVFRECLGITFLFCTSTGALLHAAGTDSRDFHLRIQRKYLCNYLIDDFSKKKNKQIIKKINHTQSKQLKI